MALKNEASYSDSRANMLDACARQYFYGVYRMWNGWWYGKRPPASRDAEEAYVAKHASTGSQWAGKLVHGSAEHALKSARRQRGFLQSSGGMRGLATALSRRAAGEIDVGLRQARTQRTGNPKQRIQLVEVTHGLPFDESQFRNRVRSRIAALCADGDKWDGDFAGTNLFERAISASDRIVAVEELVRTEIRGVTMFLKVDLLMRSPKESRDCSVIDWKTGKPRDSDVQQLELYTVWAHSVGWRRVSAFDAYLGDESTNVVRHNIDPDAAAKSVGERVARFRDSLAGRLNDGDLDKNVPIESKFEPTTNASQCTLCSFARLCERDGTKPR